MSRHFRCPHCNGDLRIVSARKRRPGTHWRGLFSGNPACGAEGIAAGDIVENHEDAACKECRALGRGNIKALEKAVGEVAPE